MVVLDDAPDDPEQDVAAHVSIVNWIDVLKLAMFDQFAESEWVGIVARNETDPVHCEEGAENGSALDEDVVVEENCQDTKYDTTADRDSPKQVDAIADVVEEGVVKNDSNGEATPSGKEESANLRELSQEVTNYETSEDCDSSSYVELPLLGCL